MKKGGEHDTKKGEGSGESWKISERIDNGVIQKGGHIGSKGKGQLSNEDSRGSE